MLASSVGPINNGNASPAAFMSPTAPIGGTSGGVPGQGGGANVLSMNLGGVNVNFDMGPSTGDLATQAYNFLGNSFNADSALLGNTIIGSQNFVSGFAAPVLQMAQTQEDFNTQVLPSMFGTLSAQNYSLGSQAINAEAGVAQASVAASSAASANASSGGGGCFITTAVCERRGEKDDCETLTKLRGFRDTFMQETPQRKALVWLYYKTAPSLVRAIQHRADAGEYLDALFDKYIAPACAAIDRGENRDAFTLYTQMLFQVQEDCT
jgi:hypothetical protein